MSKCENDAQSIISNLSAWAHFVESKGSSKLLLDAANKLEELVTICEQTYQVVGSLSDDLGVFNNTKVVDVLDNLSFQELIHEDVLPFPSFEDMNNVRKEAMAYLETLANFGGTIQQARELSAKGLIKIKEM